MKPVKRSILELVVGATTEPIVIVRIDRPDWPVALSNAAFDALCRCAALEQPFADVVEMLAGRDAALEVSETVRSRQETSFPVEIAGREFLLVLKPLQLEDEESCDFYGAFWRSGAAAASGGEDSELHHALLRAKRRIHDLSRDDPVTGLLNDAAFREVFAHDWAVAAREKSRLSVVVFRLDEFDAYLNVFGRHAADSCLRRVGQAIRRCLRRASDVVARPDGARFIALSHTADEAGVRDFAARIATSVRELGLHHPRSTSSRFVTVSNEVVVVEAASDGRSPAQFLDDLLAGVAE